MPILPMALPIQREIICQNFANGYCRYGTRCKFSHDPPFGQRAMSHAAQSKRVAGSTPNSRDRRSGSWGSASAGKRSSLLPDTLPASSAQLLITIGPQCAGKTTYIRDYSRDVIDIAIDDAPGVYRKMKIADIIGAAGELELLYRENVCSIPLYERYKQVLDDEQGQILLLFTQQITFEEFEKKMGALLSEAEFAETKRIFLEVVEEVITSSVFFESETIDIFIRELIYPNSVHWAQDELLKAATTHTSSEVSWGNTNLIAKDYSRALEIAGKCGRPVKFVRWGYELPRVTCRELFLRNVLRYLKTGRYIPSKVIQRCLQSAEVLLAKGDTCEKLANLAGFSIDSDGKVVRLIKEARV